ncbi:unnamed protein product, partial [Ceratitis capitata]
MGTSSAVTLRASAAGYSRVWQLSMRWSCKKFTRTWRYYFAVADYTTQLFDFKG